MVMIGDRLARAASSQDAERPDEREHREARRVADACCAEQVQPGEEPSRDRASHRHQRDDRPGVSERDRADGDPDRDAIDHERSRVVEQALSLEHVQDPPWQAKPTENRRGRRGIRRGDDGAERDCGGDRETPQTPPDPRNRRGGETDGNDDEGCERDDVPPEVAGRCVERRVQQDGGDEERKRQVGLDLELGTCRDEGQRGAGDREQRGIGNPDTPRDTGQDHRSEEECQRRFEECHVRSLECSPNLGEAARRGSPPSMARTFRSRRGRRRHLGDGARFPCAAVAVSQHA
jgi:hypothetical protein